MQLKTCLVAGDLFRDPALVNGIQFTVYGIPQPQGSTRAFVPKGWSRPIITTANPHNASWRRETALQAMQAMTGRNIWESAVELTADFYFDRPKSQKKALYKTTKPDVDKLARSIQDAMTGIVYRDDSQVAILIVRKHYGSPARAEVQVRQLSS